MEGKKPKWSHDCTGCRFLGRYVPPMNSPMDKPVVRDLYFCDKSDGGTVIARYGDDGPDYSSLPLTVLIYAHHDMYDPLVIAFKRALPHLKWTEVLDD